MTVLGTGTGRGYGVYAVGIHTVSDNRFADLWTAIYVDGDSKYRNDMTTVVTTLAAGNGTDGGGNN